MSIYVTYIVPYIYIYIHTYSRYTHRLFLKSEASLFSPRLCIDCRTIAAQRRPALRIHPRMHLEAAQHDRWAVGMGLSNLYGLVWFEPRKNGGDQWWLVVINGN